MWQLKVAVSFRSKLKAWNIQVLFLPQRWYSKCGWWVLPPSLAIPFRWLCQEFRRAPSHLQMAPAHLFFHLAFPSHHSFLFPLLSPTLLRPSFAVGSPHWGKNGQLFISVTFRKDTHKCYLHEQLWFAGVTGRIHNHIALPLVYRFPVNVYVFKTQLFCI